MSNDIIKLEKYMTGQDLPNEKSLITSYFTCSVVYKWTNEILNIYPAVSLEGKRVLAITASGDHALEAIINGASDIDSVDINIFSKYVSALKIAMIRKYDIDKFSSQYRLFTIPLADVNELSKILDEVSLYLSKDVILFWETYIKCLREYRDRNLFTRELFWNDGGAFKKNKYSEKCVYGDLKEKLQGVSIKYYDSDIKDIGRILPGNIYDAMYLSNILERVDTFDSAEDCARLIKRLLSRMNDKGIIYNYLFKCGIRFNKHYNSSALFFDFYDDLKVLFREEYFYEDKDYDHFNEAVVKLTKR